MVSARTLSSLITWAAFALASKASFNWTTAPSPQRVVIFMSVLGCGTASVMAMRQKRRQAKRVGHLGAERLEAEAVRKRKNIMRR